MRQLHAGAMRYRLTIQQVTESRSKSGAITETWSDYVTVSAEKVDVTGREILSAGKVEATVDTRFRIKYRPDLKITPQMRCVCEGEVYSLEAPVIDPDGRKYELHLLCKRVV